MISGWVIKRCAAAGLASALLVFALQAQAQTVDEIVAVVNQGVVTRSEVTRYAAVLRRAQAELSPQAAEGAALEELINRQLQLNRAAVLGLSVNPTRVQEQINNMKRELNLPNRAALLAFAEQEFGISTLPQLEKQIGEDIIIQGVFYREVFEQTPVYEEEIDRYLRNSNLSESVRYDIAHILLPLTQRGYEVAQQVHDRLLRGESDYAALAQEFSIDDKTKAAGTLGGFVAEEDLPFAFVDELSNLEVGDVGNIIETSRGYHVIKLLGRRGGEVRSEVVQYQLQHVFVELDEEATINTAYEALRANTPFEDVVSAYSADERSVAAGGNLGWFEEANVPPFFAAVVAELAAGEFSEPLRSPYGWHIVRLADKRVETPNMQELRNRARAALKERRALSQRPIWLKQLRSKAYIRIVAPEFLALDE